MEQLKILKDIILNTPLIRSVAQNSGMLLTGGIIGDLSKFIRNIILARILVPAEFGKIGTPAISSLLFAHYILNRLTHPNSLIFG